MKRTLILTLLSLSAIVSRAEAHAEVEHSEPAVGSKVHTAPTHVELTFSEEIEPAFSSVQVFDDSGQQVDKRDKHLDRTRHNALAVSVPPLKPGRYRVVWRAVSTDTHATKGDFTFQVAP